MNMIKEKTWKDFQNSGFLWWTNRILHTFGWVIVIEKDLETNDFKRAFPATTKFRGFTKEAEEEGFKKVTKYIKANIKQIEKDLEE